MHLSTPRRSDLGSCLFYGDGYVVVDSLFIVAPIVCGGSVFGDLLFSALCPSSCVTTLMC